MFSRFCLHYGLVSQHLGRIRNLSLLRLRILGFVTNTFQKFEISKNELQLESDSEAPCKYFETNCSKLTSWDRVKTW